MNCKAQLSAIDSCAVFTYCERQILITTMYYLYIQTLIVGILLRNARTWFKHKEGEEFD